MNSNDHRMPPNSWMLKAVQLPDFILKLTQLQENLRISLGGMTTVTNLDILEKCAGNFMGN